MLKPEAMGIVPDAFQITFTSSSLSRKALLRRIEMVTLTSSSDILVNLIEGVFLGTLG